MGIKNIDDINETSTSTSDSIKNIVNKYNIMDSISVGDIDDIDDIRNIIQYINSIDDIQNIIGDINSVDDIKKKIENISYILDNIDNITEDTIDVIKKTIDNIFKKINSVNDINEVASTVINHINSLNDINNLFSFNNNNTITKIINSLFSNAPNKGYCFGGGSASACVFDLNLNSSTTLVLQTGSKASFSSSMLFGSHRGAINQSGIKGSNAGINISGIATVTCYGGGGANKSPGAGGSKPTVKITNSSKFTLVSSSAGHSGSASGKISD